MRQVNRKRILVLPFAHLLALEAREIYCDVDDGTSVDLLSTRLCVCVCACVYGK